MGRPSAIYHTGQMIQLVPNAYSRNTKPPLLLGVEQPCQLQVLWIHKNCPPSSGGQVRSSREVFRQREGCACPLGRSKSNFRARIKLLLICYSVERAHLRADA